MKFVLIITIISQINGNSINSILFEDKESCDNASNYVHELISTNIATSCFPLGKKYGIKH